MGSFDGVAEIYARSRRGYPPELRDHLVRIDALRPDSAVVDLGAGTGQLAMMAADVAPNVVAVDPEPDMIRKGRDITADRSGIRWIRGSDHDLPTLVEPPIDLVLIGNAFHHMAQSMLLTTLDSLLGRDGAVVVCSTSIPVWLQASDWSAALREQLGRELGHPVDGGGTPDHESDETLLRSSPFSKVERWVSARDELRSVDSVIGEVISSASGALDGGSVERLRRALSEHAVGESVTENVVTTALIARRP